MKSKKLNALWRLALIIFIIIGFVWGGLALAANGTQATPYPSYQSSDFFFPPYPAENERLGFGQTSNHDPTPLNAGWYLNWAANNSPAHPNGVEYARLINLFTGLGFCQPATQASQVTPSLTGTALIQAVQRHPGALWLIGNEPDSLYNGHAMQAELYAEFYHYFVTTIKAVDPKAKVAIAAIVQPSPLRIEYLDKVLDHYQTTYHHPLPTDLWNIHFYIMNEGPCGSWGAAVPPFSSQSYGWQLDFNATTMLDLTAMENRLQAFRGWMFERGYQDMPLIITELGVLPKPSFAEFSNPVAAQFLTDVFTMLRTATDPVVGYPADEQRLAQMWAWFSTDYEQYGGDLFETGIANLTVIGEAFAAQANALYTPYIDLQVTPPMIAEPLLSVSTGPTEEIMTVGAYVNNLGNVTATHVQAQIELIDYLAQTVLAADTYPLGPLGKRYEHPPVYVKSAWPITRPAAFTVTITADPDQVFSDPTRANNTLSQAIIWYPDLALTQLDGVARPFSDDEDLMTTLITATITNTGNWTATESHLQLQLLQDPGLQDPIPPQTRLITVPSLGPGQTLVATATWTTDAFGLYRVEALIKLDPTSGLDLNIDNNQRLKTLSIRPNLNLQKQIMGPDTVPLLRVVTYTLTLSNTGVGTATNVMITDMLPAALTFDGYTQPAATFLPVVNTITWGPDNIPAGGGYTIVFTATVTGGTIGQLISNTAEASADNARNEAATATFTITAALTNTHPVARDDRAATLKGTAATINVLNNDTDPNGDRLFVERVGQPADGSAGANDQIVTYTPTTTFTGLSVFTYTASDGSLSDVAVVTVTVVPGDAAATATPITTATLIYTRSQTSHPVTVTLAIPPGAVAETMALIYTERLTNSHGPPAGFQFAGHSFTLAAYLDGMVQTSFAFQRPVTLTLAYTPDDSDGLSGLDEALLELRAWDGQTWSKAGITIVERDTANHRLVVTLYHLTEFSLFKPVRKTDFYLPLLVD